MASVDYDRLWSFLKVRSPRMWYTWSFIKPYAQTATRRLEVGAGLLPKFPVQGTWFLDTSKAAIQKLQEEGARGVVLNAQEPFPFKEQFFDLVGSFETLEHLEKPENALGEIARVLKDDGRFLFSVPLHAKYWSQWDTFAGHVQRFEPCELESLLAKQGFKVEKCYTLWHREKYNGFISWCASLSGHIAPYFLTLCFMLHHYFAEFYAWITKKLVHPLEYSSLNAALPNSTAVFVVCKKIKLFDHPILL